MKNITWSGTATAISSISHGSETRGLITMLRRETIIGADGTPTPIPLISGNSFRGRLRRAAEQQLADVLHYRGRLTIAAAAALRSGGSLVKTSAAPISGSRLARLRELVPLIGIFGTAGAGRIIDGCLQVGKLVPYATETAHLLGSPTATLSVHDLTQIETYSRVDDTHRHNTAAPTTTASDDAAASQLQYRLETFRAGTRFDVWLNLVSPTDIEAAFLADVLDRYSATATIAGRTAIGHGRLRLDVTASTPPPHIDWRTEISTNADEAIDMLNQL